MPARTTHVDGVAGDGYISGFRSFDFVTPFTSTGAIPNRPWTVIGTGAPEFVGASTDYPIRFLAAGGGDRFVDGVGDDTYDGGPGTDEIAGSGGGNDTCTAVEVGLDKCETVTP
jgi:hypothetical protein